MSAFFYCSNFFILSFLLRVRFSIKHLSLRSNTKTNAAQYQYSWQPPLPWAIITAISSRDYRENTEEAPL